MKQLYLKEKSITSLVMTMALPSTISMLVNALYNIIDSYFVAKISGKAMTALSLVFPIQNLVISILVGLGIGINVLIAFYLGAENEKTANQVASIGLICNMIQGLILTIGCVVFCPHFLRFFSKDTEIIQLGTMYGNIVFVFTLALSISVSFEKIFQAVGKMMEAMFCMIMGCVVNVILDPILIFGLGMFPEMGIKGAAIATVIGQIVTTTGYLVFYFKKPLLVKVKFSEMKISAYLLKRMYAIAVPASLNMALPSLQISVLNSILSSFAEEYVLVLGAYYKLQTVIYTTANGVVQGMRPLIGFNYGAGEMKRVKQTFRVVLWIILGLMSLGTIICMIIPQTLIGLFSNDVTIIMIGETTLRTISIGFVASALSITVSGELEGLGKGMPSLMISLCRYVIIMLPVAFIMSRLFDSVGVWHAFWITEVIVAFISFLIHNKILLI